MLYFISSTLNTVFFGQVPPKSKTLSKPSVRSQEFIFGRIRTFQTRIRIDETARIHPDLDSKQWFFRRRLWSSWGAYICMKGFLLCGLPCTGYNTTNFQACLCVSSISAGDYGAAGLQACEGYPTIRTARHRQNSHGQADW